MSAFGKAFLAGLGAALGVTTAVVGVSWLAGRQVKATLRGMEQDFRSWTDDLLHNASEE